VTSGHARTEEVTVLATPPPALLPPAPAASRRGLPVVLVGGLASTPASLLPMREHLARTGFPVSLAPVGFGAGCGARTADAIVAALLRAVAQNGRPALLVGHSRGGQLSRAVTVRRPDLVAGLVTIGSPLTRLLGLHAVARAEVAALALAGTVGVPGLLRASCRWGACCRGLRDDVLAPFPAGVAFLSVYSPADRVVDWRSSLDPAAELLAVDSSHSGLLCDDAVLAAVAALARRLSAVPAARPAVAAAAA
jgi:pimeloyl-ACP methyl ester carboxylesterase